MNSLGLLQCGKDAGAIGGLGTTLGSEHSHQALGWNTGAPLEVLKAHRCFDVVPEHGLAGGQITINDAFHGLPEKGLTEMQFAL
jgi:hypothetical protein